MTTLPTSFSTKGRSRGRPRPRDSAVIFDVDKVLSDPWEALTQAHEIPAPKKQKSNETQIAKEELPSQAPELTVRHDDDSTSLRRKGETYV